MRCVEPPLRDQSLERLPNGGKRELLRVLESNDVVRADVIRQFYQRGDTGMVEVLSHLEADDVLRLRIIGELRRTLRLDG
jgi:hypothetical protein